MHNTVLDNLRFQVTWCESNLRYLLGNPASEENTKLINYMKKEIEEIKRKIEEIEP